MKKVAQGLLYSLGAAAIAIALSIFVRGPMATLAGGKQAFDALMGTSASTSPAWGAEIDSELRFYASLFGAYGALLILAARDLAKRLDWVPWLAGAFFVGGVGRAISIGAAGAPHPFLICLMATELAVPPLLILCWHRLSADRRAMAAAGAAKIP